MIKNKRTSLLIGIIGVLSILIGVTYAFFNYTRIGQANTISVGRISFSHGQTNTIALTNVFPIDSDSVSTDTGNTGTVTITITGDTTYDDGIEYLLTVANLDNKVNNKEIPISVIVTGTNIGTNDTDYFENRGGSSSLYKVLTEGKIKDNKELLVGYITKGATGVNGTVIIKAYIDKDNIAISDTYDGNESDNNGTTNDWVDGRTVLTTTEWNSLQSSAISFQVKVEANEGIWVEEPLAGEQMVRRAITAKINAETNACNPIWVDNMDTPDDETDDITYFSGTNECVDMNYVWYSGKLWRIISINPDGNIKLITENAITTIRWGSTYEFNGSEMYQWLNEDFYDTLYNHNNVLINTIWNSSTDISITVSNPPARPSSLQQQNTTLSPVGLITAYEVYNSSRNASKNTSFIVTDGSSVKQYYWWTLTAYDSTHNFYVTSGDFGHTSSNSFSVRPSITVNGNLTFNGEGTLSNPYTISVDKEFPTYDVTLINSRSSGEYVNFDGELYRIVDVNNGITKIIKTTSSESYKKYASTMNYGDTNNTQSEEYWDYYLNNTWYNNISTSYKNMLVDNTFYRGVVFINSYKKSICTENEELLNNIKVSDCTKYSDSNSIFVGKVGLSRLGEMFSGSRSSTYWLITPTGIGNSPIWRVYQGYLVGTNINSNVYNAYPVITLKSSIKITGGTGYSDSPFEISE